MRNIADTHIVVPTGERVIEFKGMMTLNDSGRFIWDCMTQDITYDRLLGVVLQEYQIDEEKAREDLDEFLKSAREAGVLDE